jgi:hypothetical protein
MKKYLISGLFFILIIIFGLSLAPMSEGFAGGIYPNALDKPILNDYPLINKKTTSNNNYSDIWWHYPVLPESSFKQVTNNLRYHYNPDQGNCVRADFCGALYHNIKNKSNVINPLPPAQEGPGARVGYYRTEPNNLPFSIPTNENILY